MIGRRFLLTLRKKAEDYGIFVAVILGVWLIMYFSSRAMFGPMTITRHWSVMGFSGFRHMDVFLPSFAGIFSAAACINFIVAGALTTQDMRNLNQMGTTKSTAMLMSLSINLMTVLISAIIVGFTARNTFSPFDVGFGTRFIYALSMFIACYGTTFLFNAITTYFRPMVSTIIIVALLILPNPISFYLGFSYRQLIMGLLELLVGAILFVTRSSMLKSSND